MTHDEIMAMAREAGFRTGQLNLSNGPPVPFIAPASGTSCMFELERFAALVAEAEREACAKVCEAHADGWGKNPGNNPIAGFIAASNCAGDIRLRSNAGVDHE